MPGTTMLPWAVLSFRGRGALTPPLIRVVALWPILMGFLHYVLVGCPFPHTSDGVEGMAFFHPLAGTTNLPWAVMSLRGRGALTPPLIHVVALRPILMGFIRVVALWPILMGNFRRGWKAWPFSNPCRDDKFAMGCYVVSRSGSLTTPLIRVVALWPILMGWAIRPSHSYQTVQRLYCLLVPGIEPGRYGNYRAHRAGC